MVRKEDSDRERRDLYSHHRLPDPRFEKTCFSPMTRSEVFPEPT